MNTATQNILAWRETATAADEDEGRDWYPFARRMVGEFAAAYGVPPEIAAAAIAVISPRCSWDQNLAAAESVLKARANGHDIPRPKECPGAYYGNVLKAWRITDPSTAFHRCNGSRVGKRGGMVKCNGHSHGCNAAGQLHGPKVNEFFETILGKLDGRVVDVWCCRAADVSPWDVLTLARDDPRRVGDPGNRFGSLQAAYAQAAAIIGEDPSVTQAIVWTRIRRTWKRRGGALQTEIPF
jgi:hypothetical protein